MSLAISLQLIAYTSFELLLTRLKIIPISVSSSIKIQVKLNQSTPALHFIFRISVFVHSDLHELNDIHLTQKNKH